MPECQTLLNDLNIRDRIVDFCRDPINDSAMIAALVHPLLSQYLYMNNRWRLDWKFQGDIYITRVYVCCPTVLDPFIKMFVYTDITDTIVIKMVPNRP